MRAHGLDTHDGPSIPGNHLPLIALILLLEAAHGGHGNHARGDARLVKGARCGRYAVHVAAGGDEGEVVGGRAGEGVGAAGDQMAFASLEERHGAAVEADDRGAGFEG